MCSADGHPDMSGVQERKGPCCFGAKTPNRTQFGDFLAHGLNDPPAAEECPQSNSGMTYQYHPKRDFETRQVTHGKEDPGNDSHGFLRVIGSMPQAVKR